MSTMTGAARSAPPHTDDDTHAAVLAAARTAAVATYESAAASTQHARTAIAAAGEDRRAATEAWDAARAAGWSAAALERLGVVRLSEVTWVPPSAHQPRSRPGAG